MKILALTATRSEYDLLSPLYKLLHLDNDCEFKLLVSGSHVSASFGNTIRHIQRDGYDILLEIESLIDGDSNASRLKSASVLLISAIDTVKAYAPDLIIYAGDREEVIIGGLLGGYLSIPTVHFYGGDHACDGHIDNPIRHATSKLSTCHFVSVADHRDRLLALKEPSERIFNIGSIALDKFTDFISLPNISSKIAGIDLSNKRSALFIFHPVESEIESFQYVFTSVLEILQDLGIHCFIGSPNTDKGNSEIKAIISEFKNKFDNITSYESLARDEFLSLFKQSCFIIGNSSAGLLEAASIPIPCINIGLRQQGRLCSNNVLFVDANYDAIKQGVTKALSEKFILDISSLKNIYGSGRSSQKALSLIKTIDFRALLLKKEDPLSA